MCPVRSLPTALVRIAALAGPPACLIAIVLAARLARQVA
jgi:hypothetical protein